MNLNDVFDNIMAEDKLTFTEVELQEAIETQLGKVLVQITKASEHLLMGLSCLYILKMTKEKSPQVRLRVSRMQMKSPGNFVRWHSVPLPA